MVGGLRLDGSVGGSLEDLLLFPDEFRREDDDCFFVISRELVLNIVAYWRLEASRFTIVAYSSTENEVVALAYSMKLPFFRLD